MILRLSSSIVAATALGLLSTSSLVGAQQLQRSASLNRQQNNKDGQDLPKNNSRLLSHRRKKAQQKKKLSDTRGVTFSLDAKMYEQEQIVGGEEVVGGNGVYPFQVQLEKSNGYEFCGGSLIAPDMVLTAAHCIHDGNPTHIDIWNGSRMQPREVQTRLIHPNYDDYDMYNDISLVKLTEPALPVNEVNDGNGGPHWELVVDDYDWINHPPMIRLQRYQTPSGCTSLYSQGLGEEILTLTVIGHGTTKSGGGVPGKLLEADVHYVLNSVCNEQYWGGLGWPISDDMLCAADTEEGEDACQGDSGGPLFTRLPVGENSLYTLVGTTSWGYGCADPEFPGVYSRVAKNTEWIDNTVCNNLSPKSCTADGKIRDYAVESLTGNSLRRTQNMSTNNNRTLADLTKGDEYGGDATQKEELCELLGGDVDEETLPPTSSSPTITSSPSHAPIIAPSMLPSVSPSLMPSTSPSGSPSLPPGKSPTKKFITKTDRNGNQKAKGVMYTMKADTGDVNIETIAFKTKDNKEAEVQIYFQLGSYATFPGKGMGITDWGVPIYNGIPEETPNGLRKVVLNDVLTIPKGHMASIYLVGKKEFIYEEGQQEFAVAENAGDFQIFTGFATKKAFEKRLASADFVGGITYYTMHQT